MSSLCVREEDLDACHRKMLKTYNQSNTSRDFSAKLVPKFAEVDLEWTYLLHVYTDGPTTDERMNARVGLFCKHFERCLLSRATGSMSVGAKGGGVIDSQAIKSVCRITDNLEVLRCRRIIDDIVGGGTTLRRQWIPGHAVVLGNEKAFKLARDGAGMMHINAR